MPIFPPELPPKVPTPVPAKSAPAFPHTRPGLRIVPATQCQECGELIENVPVSFLCSACALLYQWQDPARPEAGSDCPLCHQPGSPVRVCCRRWSEQHYELLDAYLCMFCPAGGELIEIEKLAAHLDDLHFGHLPDPALAGQRGQRLLPGQKNQPPDVALIYERYLHRVEEIAIRIEDLYHRGTSPEDLTGGTHG